LLIPIVVASAFFFITPTDFVDSGDSMTDAIVGTLFGFGFLAILFIVLFFTLIWIGIQYLILVMLPKSSQRTIERGIIMKQTAPIAPPHPAKPKRTPVKMYPQIEAYVTELRTAFDTISKERKAQLKEVAECVARKRTDNESINLMFICTHNSRRSQFGQIWAAVAASHRGISGVQTFSGGTEETAFNKRAVSAIERAGLKVEGTVSTNPRYSVRFSDEVGALDCFSKVYDSNSNPQKGFIAVMTCSDADENCPIVTGAEQRFRITYEDPKVADRTAQEAEVYDERCKQIATEMLYLFSLID
jgi:protein-tyrosine-phosphatase